MTFVRDISEARLFIFVLKKLQMVSYVMYNRKACFQIRESGGSVSLLR